MGMFDNCVFATLLFAGGGLKGYCLPVIVHSRMQWYKVLTGFDEPQVP